MTSHDGLPARVDRRTTIKWLAATMAATQSACGNGEPHVGAEIPPAPRVPNKLLGTAGVTDAAGYGTDPDRMTPVVPWSRTMTEAQRLAAAALADTILPEDDRSPAASALGVEDFIDEWVSAPYPAQQDDREKILAGLEWLEQQSRSRFDSSFAMATQDQRGLLVDEIAAPRADAGALAAQAEFFDRFRFLAVGAFFTTEPGMEDIGYVGNVAIGGDYPGPSREAMEHLAGVLKTLGLSLDARGAGG